MYLNMEEITNSGFSGLYLSVSVSAFITQNIVKKFVIRACLAKRNNREDFKTELDPDRGLFILNIVK